MEKALKIDLNAVGGSEDDVSEIGHDEDTKLTTDSAIDELMSALDALDCHADDSIQVSRDTEMYWITTLNERDELILSNKKSVRELQMLNEKLREENQMLREQLSLTDHSGIVTALQDDANQSRNLSMQLQAELAALQLDVVARLKDQNAELQGRLVKCGQHYSEVFNRLRQMQQQHPKIAELYADLEQQTEKLDDESKSELKRQVEELCNGYDLIISQACDECEQHLYSIQHLEHENLRLSAQGRASVSPRKSRPGSSLETDKYYTQLLQSSENSNAELRKEVERLHKEMNSREQQLFGETMARTEHTNREQIEKMKAQISELSQEMSLLNVDNRALREKILRTENENEILVKRVKDSAMADKELNSLQRNLDSQLDLNHQLEGKVKQLELIRMEHNSICQTIKTELDEANKISQQYDYEHKQLSQKLRASSELQQNYDTMITDLNSKLQQVRNENVHLSENLKHAQHQLEESQQLSVEDLSEHRNHDDIIHQLHDIKEKHLQELQELRGKLETAEKQKENANLKVRALRERLKTMQDSWQKISTDTETSFTALREQYQQQIKEYKSIVQSLKSQNASLNIRIDSLKKVTSQHSASQVNALEQQIAEYKQITSGYREENILLRKELRTIVQELQNESLMGNTQSKLTHPDEFARLRDILNTARSDCENLQLHKTPASRGSSVERKPSITEERASSVDRRASSRERRASSTDRGSSRERGASSTDRGSSRERRASSTDRGSSRERGASSTDRGSSAERRASYIERNAGSTERKPPHKTYKDSEVDSRTDDSSKYSTSRFTNGHSTALHSVSGLFQTTSLQDKLQPLDKDKPWNRLGTRQNNGKELLAVSSPREEKEPLAISTPRQVKSAEYKSNAADGSQTNNNTHSESRRNFSASVVSSGHQPSSLVTNSTKDYGRTKFEYSGNIRSIMSESKSQSLDSSPKPVKVEPRPMTDRHKRPSTFTHNVAGAVSKTKEVVEIKNRNSVELDPSKSFKPINPDDHITKEIDIPKSHNSYRTASYTSSKPTYLTTNQKYNVTNSAARSYDRPYRSKYEPAPYRSKYYSSHDSKSTADDYKNISADSAYGSPSRSFSKAPSVTSHSGSYHKPYTLPSLLPSQSKYSTSSQSKDSLTKLLDYEIEQTNLLNRTLDDLELSMDSVTSMTNTDRQRLNPVAYDSNMSYSRKYKMPSTASIHLSSDLRDSHYSKESRPKKIAFHGTVVYESIYH